MPDVDNGEEHPIVGQRTNLLVDRDCEWRNAPRLRVVPWESLAITQRVEVLTSGPMAANLDLS
jgi:hypothetical protein